jgi:hypothetical protein
MYLLYTSDIRSIKVVSRTKDSKFIEDFNIDFDYSRDSPYTRIKMFCDALELTLKKISNGYLFVELRIFKTDNKDYEVLLTNILDI